MTIEAAKKLILVICGGKGGVGKTAVYRSLLDYLLEVYGDVVVPVEADAVINDVQRYFPNRQLIRFSESLASRGSADRLIDFAVEGVANSLIVVNLPGNSWEEYKVWLQELGFSGDGDSGLLDDCEILQFFVTDGTRGSIDMLEKSVVELENQPRHILVRNNGRLTSGGGWSYLEEDEGLQKLLQETGVPVCDFPGLAGDTMYKVESAGIPFGDFVRPKGSDEYRAIRAAMNGAHHQRVVYFRRAYTEMFDNVFQWIGQEGFALPERIETPSKEKVAVGASTGPGVE